MMMTGCVGVGVCVCGGGLFQFEIVDGKNDVENWLVEMKF